MVMVVRRMVKRVGELYIVAVRAGSWCLAVG